MSFIKKIFEGKIDEEVKKHFARFSKGVFEDRAMVKIRVEEDRFKLQTSFEYINELVLLIADNIEEIEVNGKLVRNRKKEEVSTLVTSTELKGFKDEYDFLLLNMEGEDISLKCKPSLPKPGKKLKADFCTVFLPLKLLKEFVFDVSEDFKRAEIAHDFVIDDIVVPDEYKSDPLLARKMAIRKGKLVRKILLDGKRETIKEVEFAI